MQSDVIARKRDVCRRQEVFPLATVCSTSEKSSDSTKLDSCVGELGSGLICKNELHGIVSRTCDGMKVTQFTDVSQLFNWIFLSHVDESMKLLDNEYFRYFLFSILDFFAYYIGTDKIADDFEIVKFLF